MKSIEKLYREFYKKNINKEKEKDIIYMADFASIMYMHEASFSKDAVMDFIHANSPLANNLDLSLFKDYFNTLCAEGEFETWNEDKNDKSAKVYNELLTIYKDTSKEIANEYEQCYFDLDVLIFDKLLDRGFNFGEIDLYLSENTIFSKRVYDKVIIQKYAERVLEKIRSVRFDRSQLEISKAESKYNELKNIFMNNYIEGEEINQKQQIGEIVLELLLTEGFMYETVKKILSEHIVGEDKNIITEILNDCSKIKKIYIEINEAGKFEDSSSFEEVYFSYTKDYLIKNSLLKLTFDDDCQIAKEILKGLEEAGQAGDYYIRNNLTKFSPVALEPWRDKEVYLNAVFSRINSDDSKKINKKEMYFIEKTFTDTRNKITNKINEYKTLFTSNEYRAVLSIRELFVSHYNEQDIKDMFYQNFNIKTDKEKIQISLMIEKAKQMLKKESELKNVSFKRGLTPKVSRNNHIANLKKEGLTSFDVYRIVLERKIYDTPSISNRLYETFLDIDMAESCLSQYRDFDKEELKEIISDSPRAILLSNMDISEAKDYADNVIRKAEERLKKANEIQYEKDIMESLIYQEADIIKQGINISGKLEYPYQYSRSALKLFIKGGDELAVSEIILNLATKFNIDNPEKFTENIITNAKEIYRRMLNIKNYEEDTDNINKVQKEYLRLMHEKYLINSSLKKNMDIDVIAELLNNFSKQEISTAALKCSPWTAEIGRTEKYVTNYLIPQAESKILSIKNKLAKASPIHREEFKTDIVEEYNDLQVEIKKQYPIIPYDIKMDEIIILSLVLEKFNLDNIKILLNEHSPLKNSQSNYGESMVKRVSNIYLNSKTI